MTSESNGQSTISGRGTSIKAGSHGLPLALTILGHPDLERVGDRALLPASAGPLALSRTEPKFARPGEQNGQPLNDEHLSRKPLRLLATGDGGAAIDLDESGTSVLIRGRRLVGGAQFSAAQVRRGVVLELGHRVVLLLHTLTPNMQQLGDAPTRPREMVGESDAIRNLLWDIRNVADFDQPVLIRGETGSGKELVAQALHNASPRRAQPFIAVNLGAVTPTLAMSELFGAEQNSHSVAKGRQVGYAEQARGGTLFLDEIGEAPAELQVALLRFLETGEAPAIGAKVRKLDVRIIAATDANLEAKIAAGTFRAPLLMRLATLVVATPPLRARRDDIGRLFTRFLREEMERIGEASRLRPPTRDEKPWLPASVVARLADLEWPYNVRQLRNIARQLVAANRGKDRLEIPESVARQLADMMPPDWPAAPSTDPPPPDVPRVTRPPASEECTPPTPDVEPAAPRRVPGTVTEEELTFVGRATRWNVTAAAKQLGITRPSLYNVIKRNEKIPTSPVTASAFLQAHEACGGDPIRIAVKLKIGEWAVAQWLRKLELEPPSSK